MRYISGGILAALLAVGICVGQLHAQEADQPHWRSLRYDKVNMRVGPSTEYKIEWIYQRRGLPIKVLRQREGWFLVQDHEGTQGWVNANQTITTTRAMVIGEGLAELRDTPSETGKMLWRAEVGVIGELMRCRERFCEIDVDGRSGWVAIDRLWGAGEI